MVIEPDLADGLAVVVGHADELIQLVQNLADNAIKYGKDGTLVRIGLSDLGEKWRLSVTDRGEGIAPEHLPRLTERFYRVDTARSRAMGGTGLGLASVKHVASRHGAELAVSSKLGEGSTFSVDLPKAGK